MVFFNKNIRKLLAKEFLQAELEEATNVHKKATAERKMEAEDFDRTVDRRFGKNQ